MKKTNSLDILAYGLFVRSQIHTWHFQTKSYAEHKALDGFYTEFLDLFDGFVETYQWIFDRVKIGKNEYSIEDYKDNKSVVNFINKYVTNIKNWKSVIWDDHSDLQNILDEMIWLWNQTIYLLSLS